MGIHNLEASGKLIKVMRVAKPSHQWLILGVKMTAVGKNATARAHQLIDGASFGPKP